MPFAEAFGAVDTQHVRARLQQRRDAFGIVASVDARAHDVAFLFVDEFKRIGFVVGVVFAENHVAEALFLVDERQHVELVFPKQIVRHW